MFAMTRNVARKYGAKIATGVLTVSPLFAMAQSAPSNTFDASTYVTAILATIAGLLLIGGAVFSVRLAIKSTKWARGAL